MDKRNFEFKYEVYNDSAELKEGDKDLLGLARKGTIHAYAPYSNFQVSAVALLANGKLVSGTNQENASFPVGVCAERVLLGSAATLFPDVPIKTIAISYNSNRGKNDYPISPCGMCRQSLLEYETRTKQTIRLILSGQEGKVFIIETAEYLLPFAFTSSELK